LKIATAIIFVRIVLKVKSYLRGEITTNERLRKYLKVATKFLLSL